MPGPDLLLSFPVLAGMLAYGPAPGAELIPYFLGLLAWVGLALGAVLLSPITALLRFLRRRAKGAPQAEPNSEPKSEPITASAPESQGEARHDRA